MKMKWLLVPAVFLLVCFCGLFVGLAGGVRWGTGDAGVTAGVTLFLAFAASALGGLIASEMK